MKKLIKLSYVFMLSAALLAACSDDEDNVDAPSLNENAASSTARSELLWTGLTISKNNRLFASHPRMLSDTIPFSVSEVVDSVTVKPYPNAEWNTWNPNLPPQDHFISVQSVYVDANNNLWILDPASPQMRGVVKGGAKLLKIDLNTNQVVQKILFNEMVVYPTSYLNDVRIDTQKNVAYITDSGKGGIIVVDLSSGKSRRVLDKHYSTKSENLRVVVEGKEWRNQDESLPSIHSDGIALGPGGTYLYYHALTATSLYRINTKWLLDASLPESQVEQNVELVAKTGPVDGMIFGADSALYLTSIENNAIDRIRPEGNRKVERVVQSSKLKWPDTFTVGMDGALYVNTSQLHLGKNRTEPYRIFKIQLTN